MNLHEYQSKIIMKASGLPVQKGILCHTPAEVEYAAEQLIPATGGVCVVKAQVHAGGRGKAGGVKLAKNLAEARSAGEKILGMTLVTPQTGAEGKLVRKVYVEEGCNIGKEYYLSMLVDRSTKSIAIVASTEGGMEIEEVAHNTPEKIIKAFIDPKVGIQNFQCQEVGLKLGLGIEGTKKLTPILKGLYDLFIKYDLALIEVNPLVLTKEGTFVILDAKCAVDDNAVYRQPQLKAMMDPDELDPKELSAGRFGLSYVALDGEIGCMVNGAGLAMGTMDIIQSTGGTPANFLDVGGGATKETVTEAFKIILSDSKVKAILVNIFGGIMKCDVIAHGIIEAAKELGVKVPLVVRLQGTNVELGRKMLAESGLKIIPADTMSDAAKKVVDSIK